MSFPGRGENGDTGGERESCMFLSGQEGELSRRGSHQHQSCLTKLFLAVEGDREYKGTFGRLKKSKPSGAVGG